MSFAMLKTWIMVNVYSFLSSFITYIANVMIFSIVNNFVVVHFFYLTF